MKVVIDGRTATAPPGGSYFPEMVMDATMQPGLNHFVMNGRESMVLPRIPASILQNVSAAQTTMVTLKPEAALDLPPAQQPFLTVEIQPGSLEQRNSETDSFHFRVTLTAGSLIRSSFPKKR